MQTGLVILPYAVGSIVTSGVGAALAARAGHALAEVMLWQCGAYLLAAVAMLALPRSAARAQTGRPPTPQR